MSNFSVYCDTDNGSTSVSNYFIDEYLADANAAQIKVYLYLLRTAGTSTGISDMADMFNYTEKDICRAIKYWEKNNLLALNYDIDGSIVGIKILTPGSGNSAGFSGSNDYYVSQTAQTVTSTVSKPQPAVLVRSTNVVPAVSSSVAAYTKPEYTLDDLKHFKSQSDTSQIVFIAEQYLGKTLSSSDIKSLLFIYDVLGFSTDLIDYLLAYCADKDKKSFRYIETVAINWAEEGITTPAEAKASIGRYDKNVYTVMRALGKNNNTPTEKEADYVKRWTDEFGFSSDIILEACERSVMSTDKNRFAYADSILKSWRNEGVVTKHDIENVDAKYQRPRKNADTNFHHFDMKHNYDYDEMEKILLGQ